MFVNLDRIKKRWTIYELKKLSKMHPFILLTSLLYAFLGKRTSLLPCDPCVLSAHLVLSGLVKVSCVPNVNCTRFTLLASLRSHVSQGRRTLLLVCSHHSVGLSGGLRLGLRFLIIIPAVTTVLGTWNIYWHFSKSLEMFIWESSSPRPLFS